MVAGVEPTAAHKGCHHVAGLAQRLSTDASNRGGSMTPRLWINSLTFSDGSSVAFDKSDIVLVVGPNNAGKSATLRAIRDLLTSKSASPVVSHLTSVREGTDQEVADWLDTFTKRNNPTAPDPVFQAFGTGIHRSQIQPHWAGQNAMQALGRFFCHLLTADERLGAANPPSSIAMVREPPTHPLHYLVRDDRLEKRLSDQFRQSFGVDLVVNRSAGSQVPIHVGERPTPAKGDDRISYDYVTAIESLPQLHFQGDGMRSFAGVLLYASAGRESVVLIDEPEAFLHPPQARQLGRLLVTDKSDERQLFVATHSGDVLRGVLDAASAKVRVIRVRRTSNVNHVRQLENQKIAELWKDPLLRYSNILDGLFHEKVVVCEGDADARFYSAVSETLVEKAGSSARRPDVMFTHCGGKDRCPMVVRALREVDVPVVVVLDFDALSEEQPLRAIVEATGGNWSAFEKDWGIVKGAVEAKKPELNSAEVQEGVQKILAGVNTATFPSQARDAIQALLKRASPWSSAKTGGKAFVPSGQPTQALDRLLANLRDIGICIVEVGELEGFVRSVGSHGPKWVNEVLKLDLGGHPELELARKFVTGLLA
jgi:energy-coupling factor transporter ATP-binding protein EcfA2